MAQLSEMTGLERLLCAASLKEPDYVPVLPRTRFSGVFSQGLKLKDCFSDVENYVQAQVSSWKRLGYDGICDLMGGAHVLTEALGSKLIVSDSDQTFAEPFLKSIEEVELLEPVNLKKWARLGDALRVISRLKEEVGGQAAVIASVANPFRIACTLRGIQPLYMDMIENPDYVVKLIDYCADLSIAYSAEAIEAGADIIITTNSTASGSCISRNHYIQFVTHASKRFFQAIRRRGVPLLFHVCGNWNDRFDIVVEEGPNILHLDEVNLSEIKKTLGNRVCLMGTVKAVATMLQGTPQQVEQESRECIRQAAAGGGYILSADCSIPHRAPEVNIQAMVEARRKYGKYPITA